MSIRLYLLLAIMLVTVDSIGLPLWQVSTADFTVAARLLIGVKTGVDLLFVVSNWRRLRADRVEMLLASWLLIAALVGMAKIVLGDPDFDLGRVLRDTTPPLLFIAKYWLFRRFFRDRQIPYGTIMWPLLLVSCASVAGFYALGGASDAYVGLTPPINPAVAGAVVQSSATLCIAALLVIYFSGKRSFLLSAGVYLMWVALRFKSMKQAVKVGFLLRMGAVVAAAVVAGLLLQGAIVEKFQLTVEGLQELASVASTVDLEGEDVTRAMYVVTAGRSAEVAAILDKMTPLTWLLGQGAGLTYQYTTIEGSVVEDYANSHFSPLSLAYKYGIPYALMFYAWLAGGLRVSRRDSRTVLFWRGVLLLTLVQSLFAFNLFVEFLLPVALAAATADSDPLGLGGAKAVRLPAAMTEMKPMQEKS